MNFKPLMYFDVCLHFASETSKHAKLNEIEPNIIFILVIACIHHLDTKYPLLSMRFLHAGYRMPSESSPQRGEGRVRGVHYTTLILRRSYVVIEKERATTMRK